MVRLSSKWQARIRGFVVLTTAVSLPKCIADDLHRGTIRSRFAGHDGLWIAALL
jgi:hypothetical protein